MVKASPEWLRLSSTQQEIIKSHQVAPPVKLGDLAMQFGLKVTLVTLPDSISGEIRRVAPSEAKSTFAIRINKHDDKRRQRFTFAHEIAHFLLHADEIVDSLSDTVLYRSSLSNKLEAEANRLATDILMPAHLINAEMRGLGTVSDDDYRVVMMAKLFDVSEIAMKLRLDFKGSK